MNYQSNDSRLSDYFRRQLPVILFFIVALVGSLFVYSAVSPAQSSGVIAVSIAGQGGLSAPLRKPVAGRPFIQRFIQSPGPLNVAIIVGHQGSDSGAVCDDGLTELQINTDIATQVQAILESQDIPTQLFDEFDDRLPTFDGRVLISLHADSCGNFGPQATGYKSSVTSFADNGALQQCVEENYAATTGLGLHENTITTQMTDYHVFRKLPANVPAIILETGFMFTDREILTTNSSIPASGIASGISCFLNSQ